mmetsp:Transcript_50608/g.99557  ORF Transcript_50608/g.99557 Transcript_50608/m.99557 type:complete len:249 (+) Transcript_50608:668-1414(+)
MPVECQPGRCEGTVHRECPDKIRRQRSLLPRLCQREHRSSSAHGLRPDPNATAAPLRRQPLNCRPHVLCLIQPKTHNPHHSRCSVVPQVNHQNIEARLRERERRLLEHRQRAVSLQPPHILSVPMHHQGTGTGGGGGASLRRGETRRAVLSLHPPLLHILLSPPVPCGERHRACVSVVNKDCHVPPRGHSEICRGVRVGKDPRDEQKEVGREKAHERGCHCPKNGKADEEPPSPSFPSFLPVYPPAFL